jgi:hypothetical protein
MSVQIDRKRAVEVQQQKLQAFYELEEVSQGDLFGEQLALAQSFAKLGDHESQMQSLGLFQGLGRMLSINLELDLDLDRVHRIPTQTIIEFYRSYARYHRLSKSPEIATEILFSLKTYLDDLAPCELNEHYVPFWQVVRAEEHFKLARECQNGSYLESTHDLEVLNLRQAKECYQLFLSHYDLTTRGEHSCKEKIVLSHIRLGHIYSDLNQPENAKEHFDYASMVKLPESFATHQRIGHHLLDLHLQRLHASLKKCHEESMQRGKNRRIPDLEVIDNLQLLHTLEEQLKQMSDLSLVKHESLNHLSRIFKFRRQSSCADLHSDLELTKPYKTRVMSAFTNLNQESIAELQKMKFTLLDTKDFYSDQVLQLLKELTWFFGKVKVEHSDSSFELATWYLTRGA